MATTDEQVRVSLGISRGAVARWAGVTDGTVARFEAGVERDDVLSGRVGCVYLALRTLAAARAHAQSEPVLRGKARP